ncbi:MAG: GGDEF domain-containing protein [Treponema sp.]|nr:GGDEF domain-containing protein [Treponema sp.]
MSRIDSPETGNDFLSDPQITQNLALLQKIGVIDYINNLNREIHSFKSLFRGALDIFNRTTISDIMDAAVRQISDHFLPSFMVFIWANKDDIVIKGYKNYKQADFNLNIQSIAPFDSFFKTFPSVIGFKQLTSKLGAASVFMRLNPEIVIPIPGPAGLFGLALAGPKLINEEYKPSELVYLQELMSFVSQSIQNHLHYEQTLRDVKTGLFNNFYFMTRLNDEIARVQRNNSSASVIMIDADKFKEFNKNNGQLAGDKILESLALIIKMGVRTEDIPSRFGGEEFSVLLPDSDRQSAWAVAERLRQSAANMKVPWDPPLPELTISLGIYTFGPAAGQTGPAAAEIIARASEAMYLSKERGRNRTTVWGAGLMTKIELMKLDAEITGPV